MLNSANLFLAENGLGAQEIIVIVLVVALVLMLVVMPMFTNKKRQQAVNQLHGSLKVGDKIMTIGGIIGIVKEINQTSPVDKELVIETGVGSNKTTMIVDIKALYQVMPPQTGSPIFEAAAKETHVAEAKPVVTETKAEEAVPPVEVKDEEPVVEEKTQESVEEAVDSEEAEEANEEAEPKATTATKAGGAKKSTKKPIAKK